MIFQRLNMKKINGIFSGKYSWKFGECNGGRNIWVGSWVYLVYLQLFWELFSRSCVHFAGARSNSPAADPGTGVESG